MGKFFFFVFLAIGIYFSTTLFEKKKPKGFSPTRISSNRSYDPSWETRPLTEEEGTEVEQALGQKYLFFNRGGQCNVFFSEDGKYALKFCTKRLYTPPLWLDYLPLPQSYKQRKRWKKADKLQRDFTSYKISFEELQQETGILYLHLNPTQHLKQLHVVDHRAAPHLIDLNSCDFILQKRAQLIRPALAEMMQKNEVVQAEETIDSLLQLIVTLSQKGIYDRDPSIFTNYGLIGAKPVKVDVGSFVRKGTEKGVSTFLQTTAPLGRWLQAHYPDLYAHFDKKIEELKEEERR